MATKTITAENFHKEVFSAGKPVILDFWAEWCSPCQMLSPVISELSDRLRDTVLVGKVNVDEQPELAQFYNVTTIPTVIRFDQGRVVKRLAGYYPLEQLCEVLSIELLHETQ